jgi:DNA-binding XRE family transcriptional regulator
MSRNPEEPVYNRIEEARNTLGLTRQELADKVGVHYQTIGCEIFKGDRGS